MKKMLMSSLYGVVGVIAVLSLGRLLTHVPVNPEYSEASPTLTVRPFTDLDTALAADLTDGWELHIRPPHPGPYRVLGQGWVLGRTKVQGLICTVKDDSGTVLEELRLKGTAEFDQAIIYLETPSGRQTMAAVKRSP